MAQPRWQHEWPSDPLTVQASGSMIYVLLQDGRLLGLESSGNVLWQQRVPPFTFISLVAPDGTILLIHESVGLWGMNPRGELLWHYSHDDLLEGLPRGGEERVLRFAYRGDGTCLCISPQGLITIAKDGHRQAFPAELPSGFQLLTNEEALFVRSGTRIGCYDHTMKERWAIRVKGLKDMVNINADREVVCRTIRPLGEKQIQFRLLCFDRDGGCPWNLELKPHYLHAENFRSLDQVHFYHDGADLIRYAPDTGAVVWRAPAPGVLEQLHPTPEGGALLIVDWREREWLYLFDEQGQEKARQQASWLYGPATLWGNDHALFFHTKEGLILIGPGGKMSHVGRIEDAKHVMGPVVAGDIVCVAYNGSLVGFGVRDKVTMPSMGGVS